MLPTLTHHMSLVLIPFTLLQFCNAAPFQSTDGAAEQQLASRSIQQPIDTQRCSQKDKPGCATTQLDVLSHKPFVQFVLAKDDTPNAPYSTRLDYANW